MYSKTRNLIIASGLTLAISAANTAYAADPIAQQITEARQETQIWTTYALNPYLRANDLKVTVLNGKATLTGSVEDDVNKDLAKQIALGVSGVKEVDNKIVVQSDYVPPARSAEPSYGELIDDATVTAKVKSKLLWSTYTSGMTTNVDTRMGEVTLTGTADSPTAKELAGSLARNTSGVASVDNLLTVKPQQAIAESDKSSAKAAADEANVVTDSWISAKVKSTFMYSSNVDASDISVNTNDGVVTLSGKVDSGAERSLAIELAKNIRGVQSVESENLII